jgi:hypothetical protein
MKKDFDSDELKRMSDKLKESRNNQNVLIFPPTKTLPMLAAS